MNQTLTLENHLRAKGTTIPTKDFRVEHTSTALGATVPETVNGATKKGRWIASVRGSVGVRAHCDDLLCG